MNKFLKLNDSDYQTLFGITKQTFDCMLLLLERAYAELHKKGGRKLSKLSLSDKLTIMLEYYREYRTMRNIAFDFGVSKSMVNKTIQWVEEVLINSGEFTLPSKRKMHEKNAPAVILMDVTECEIQRPKKNRKNITAAKRKGIR